MGNMKYPCDRCKNAKNKKPCDLNNCLRWRKWFIRKWEATRKLWTTISTEENY